MASTIKFRLESMEFRKPLIGLTLSLLLGNGVVVAAETSLVCTGDGRTAYIPYVLIFSEDEVIAELAHKNVTFNVVYDDDEFFVTSKKFPGKTIYNSFVRYKYMQYRKDQDSIVADSSFDGTSPDANSQDATRLLFYIDRFNGEFRYIYYVVKDSAGRMAPWEEKYGIGTDKYIEIKGTCKLHKRVF